MYKITIESFLIKINAVYLHPNLYYIKNIKNNSYIHLLNSSSILLKDIIKYKTIKLI
jgi:hypothetical protein